ncbi:hypothetical protein CSA17_03780, partial [bacterium DOLJORAL78_65_58]
MAEAGAGRLRGFWVGGPVFLVHETVFLVHEPVAGVTLRAMITITDIQEAARRIAPHTHRTPVLSST